MQNERTIGIGILILGLSLFFGLIPVGIDSPENVDHITLSPVFWPSIIALTIALMGLLLVIKPGQILADAEDQIDPASWCDI